MSALVGALRERLVAGRRARIIASRIAGLVDSAGAVSALDVGCGSGSIDVLIQNAVPGLSIHGVDVLQWPRAEIPVEKFDGRRLPFDDNSFDAVIFIDVLHHADDPSILLREARRVARKAVVLKDVTMDGFFAYQTLRFMDWVGNAHHGVALPYNFWLRQQWYDAFKSIGLAVEQWQGKLNLYPWPASLVFERDFHFVARLGV
jgi:ubiquinone/menaquinone biosynthesis C-methylase UbiE